MASVVVSKVSLSRPTLFVESGGDFQRAGLKMEQQRTLTGKVISVNVGQPRLIEWRGQNVRTAIWKSPVQGRVMARRLNLDGDGQADLIGHGGENRAMLVYQIESYQYWQQLLGDAPYEMGRFGENLTVEGLADRDVCIGDQFRIGKAIVEVTQPRVTCYRLGIRMNRPDMPSLLVRHGRPGFYVRVLVEGSIGADDRIELVSKNDLKMSVVDVDQLLYLGKHPIEDLERALSIGALSEEWKGSFRELLLAQREGRLVGNPGLTQDTSKEPWQGFKQLVVLSNVRETSDVRSIVLGALDAQALPNFFAGQHLVLKAVTAEGKSLIRTYSLSSSPNGGTFRISIKREAGGVGSAYLQDILKPGTEIDASAPRGMFVLDADSTDPIVLLSAGIGVTPLLSMLHSLASSTRTIFWMQGARDGDHLGFQSEIASLLSTLPNGKRLIALSQPTKRDAFGKNYDLKGRLDIEVIQKMGIPKTSDFYLCGPPPFLEAFNDSLNAWGVFPRRIHFESFGASTVTPNSMITSQAEEALHYQIALTRSNRILPWTGNHSNILELAEAEHVPVQWSCRVGVCHTCEIGILDGSVEYSPTPLDAPPSGRILICCARPKSDVVLDL